MAHKKAGGSSRNGRDSESKRLGVKKFGGEHVIPFVQIVAAGNLVQIRLFGGSWPGQFPVQARPSHGHMLFVVLMLEPLANSVAGTRCLEVAEPRAEPVPARRGGPPRGRSPASNCRPR